MKIVIVWLLLGVALGMECVKQAASGTMAQVGGLDINIDTVASTCASTASCGSIISSGAYQITGAAPSSWTYELEQKGCFDVCDALSLNDGCITADYSFSTTVSTSCVTLPLTNYQSKVTVSCCSGSDGCNDAQVNTNGCTEDTDFSQYMKDLQNCWNTAYPGLIQATCDDPSLPSYIASCQPAQGASTSSTSFLSKEECTYRTTCIQPIKDVITTFAGCGCAVGSGQYTSQFMEALMADNWEQYCTNLEIDCNGGYPIVSEKYWYVMYKLVVALAEAQVDPVKAIILSHVATALNVNEKLLKITITVSRGRRLLADESEVTVTFQSDDKDMAEYAENKFNEQLATDIGIEIGAETTMIGVTTEDPYDISTTQPPSTSSAPQDTVPDTSSAPQHTVYFMALFGVIVAGFN